MSSSSLRRRVGSSVKAPTRHIKAQVPSKCHVGPIVFGARFPGSWAAPEGHVGRGISSIQPQSVYGAGLYISCAFLQQGCHLGQQIPRFSATMEITLICRSLVCFGSQLFQEKCQRQRQNVSKLDLLFGQAALCADFLLKNRFLRGERLELLHV